jgi:hypothetical protein
MLAIFRTIGISPTCYVSHYVCDDAAGVIRPFDSAQCDADMLEAMHTIQRVL